MTGPAKRWLLGTLASLATLALLVVLALYLMLDTRRGTHWFLDQVLPRVTSEVRYDSLSGTLSRGIVFTGLELSLESADIRIGLAEGSWSLLDLLGGQFPIKRLAVTDISIIVHPSEQEQEPEPGPWPRLSLPFPVSLADVQVSNLSITLGENSYLVDRIALQANIGLLQTRISKLEVTMAGQDGEQTLALSGQVGNSAPYPFNLSLEWGATLTDTPPLAGRGTLSGNLAAITLDHQLLQPSTVSSSGQMTMAFDPQRAAIDVDSIDLNIDTGWSALRLPAPVKPAMESDGRLEFRGGWNGYSFELRSRLRALPPEIPQGDQPDRDGTDPALEEVIATTLREPGHIMVSGSGRQLQVELNRLLVETAAGNIEASGQLDAGQPLRWDLSLALTELQAGLFAPQWPAVISGELRTRGFWQGERYEAAIHIDSVTGTLFDETLAGNGDITLRDSGQVIDSLILRLGENSLTIHGEITQSLSLDWQLEAPRLAQLHPALAGAATSTGTLRGTLEQPLVNAHLGASQLGYGEYAIEHLDTDFSTAQQGNMTVDLNARGIAATPLQDGNLTLQGEGTVANHRLTLGLKDGDSSLSLTLAGGLDDKTWSGTVAMLTVDNPLVGPWQLASASALQASPDTIDLATLCLTQELSQLCTRFRFDDSGIAMEGSVEDLQLARFTSALPREASITGAVNSRFAVQGPTADLRGSLSLSIDPLQLSFQPLDTDERLEHSATIAASASLDASGLGANLDLVIADVGAVNARIRSPGAAAGNPLEQPIEGAIQGRFDNLVWLGGLFPQLEDLAGTLALDMAISGNPREPRVDGNLQLDQLAMDIPMAGISLQQGRVTLAVNGASEWLLNGSVSSGAGTLTLVGAGLLWADTGPGGQLTIKGERFTLVDLPDALVLASPDLTIGLNPEVISIRGDIHIPEGRFVFKSLPERAVQVSADERIYPELEDRPQPGRPLNTRVQVTLDDSFSFEGFGLATRLGGSLRLSQRGSAPPQAVGTLTLRDGVYEAYGQALAVDRGLLIFQGPLDNPGLNITAVRKTADATVGIRIGGVAQDIQSELFSNPSLPPTDTMAILITGKAPSDMTESDANQVVNAAAALGIAQSEFITSSLQRAFGLDVLSLQGGDEYVDSSLIVGKYLTPDLFVSYVQNLFTPAGSVQLEYRLTRHLGLKARSGETQSVDLLYKIEH